MTEAVDRSEQRRAIARRLVQVSVTGVIWHALFFGGAGTLRVPSAWMYFGLYMLLMVVNLAIVAPRNPEVIVERGRFHQGTKRFDRVATIVFGISMLATPLVAGFDVRWGWTSLPEVGVYVGLVVVALGNVPIVAAMAVNPHLEQTVRIQEDRDHRVIDTGPYALVRHPMYVGAIVQQLAIPLVLGSAWAFVPAGVLVVTLIVRTALEDRTLQAELSGYEAYAQRTRARLLPGVW